MIVIYTLTVRKTRGQQGNDPALCFKKIRQGPFLIETLIRDTTWFSLR